MDAVAQMEFFEEVEASVKDKKRKGILAAIRDFQELSKVHGGLVTPASARELLNVSKARLYQLIQSGDLTKIEYAGQPYLSVNEIRLRVASDVQSGRPWHHPTPYRMLKASLQKD